MLESNLNLESQWAKIRLQKPNLHKIPRMNIDCKQGSKMDNLTNPEIVNVIFTGPARTKERVVGFATTS